MHFLDGRANVYADATLTNKYEKQTGQRKGRTLTAYERLKRRILREFPKKKLVGDIAIDDDEFQILVEYLKSFYTFTRLSGWSLCIDPLVCVTMVQIGIRYYDGGYWPHFSKVLNDNSWSINRQALMGKICINTLKAFDKAVLDENDRINTILMHGFVANKYVPSLLDFLYAYYKIDLERDLGRNDRSMMKELIRSIQSKDNTNRTYKLVQQTADAVLCNPRGSNIRLRWFLRLIDAQFWGEEIRINPENRLAGLFLDWTEHTNEIIKNRDSAGSRERTFSSPHIQFDTKEEQFYVRLPSQLVKTDNDITWDCSFGNKKQSYNVEAFESVLAYKTEARRVSISSEDLFKKLVFELNYGNAKKRFVIPEEDIRFFNKDGYSVGITALKAGEYYAFSYIKNAVASSALIESRKYRNLWFYYFDFEDGDIVKTTSGSAVSIGKRIQEGLLPKGIVKGIREAVEQLVIYDRIPSVLIKIPESKLNGTAISINGQKTRLLGNCSLTKFDLDDGTNDKGYWFELADLGCTSNGKYTVDIDVPNDRTIRKWSFVYLNGVSYSFDDEPYIFASRGSIHLKADGGVEIEQLDDSIQPDIEKGYYDFTISTARRELPFQIDGIHVFIDVPQFEYSFDNCDWHLQEYSELWHTDLPRKVWMRFPANRITLEMDNGENIDKEQEMTFEKKTSEDVFECDITRFRSWINKERVHNRILLKVPGKTIPFLDIIAHSYVSRHLLEADFKNRLIKVSFDITGKGEYYIDLLQEKTVIAEKIPLSDMRAEISTRIKSGKYRICVYESALEDDFAFDDIVYNQIYDTETEIINPRDLSGKSVEILALKKPENDIFKMKLNHRYIIRGLKPIDKEGRKYWGVWFNSVTRTKPVEVIFELVDFERLKYALVTWLDRTYGDCVEFLYDSKDKTIVCEEQKGLRSTERYRRYDCIFTDEYVFEFRIAQ